ncbi:hypothetical protein ASE27_10210 [Oerskovia sp. Root918]|uniref:hypothetical protein n=1 Tax=Oerskovia sp. Root918 TaxID=1736607 RepID=UPI0006FAD0AF|nr:hypothetical protein [Oerskovia sp. Root918]KRD36820.1 hypothetical protein ASE27_10210 [Oerskovia sp. Root918]
MSLTVGDLTPQHIGRTVTIDGAGARVTGPLSNLRVETDWITEQRLGSDESEQVPGQQTMTLAVGAWTTEGLPLTTAVEVP